MTEAKELREVANWLLQSRIVGYERTAVIAAKIIERAIEALSTAPVALEVSEERGWLIELRGHVPTWFALDAAEGEHGWTNDSLKALRFGRKADADAYISDIGWTEAFASEHSWSDSSPRRHVWWEWHNLTCCKTCGIVRRADGGNDNGVCKGAAKIGLRSAIHPAPSREAVIDRAAIIEECAAIVRRHPKGLPAPERSK